MDWAKLCLILPWNVIDNNKTNFNTIGVAMGVAIGDTDSPDIPIWTASDLTGFEVGVEWKTNDLLPN